MTIHYFMILTLLYWRCQTTCSAIFEATPSAIYEKCLRDTGSILRENPSLSVSDESLEWSCMQSFLWQTAAQREAPRNLTREQTLFLQTLLGDPLSPRAWQIIRNNAGTATQIRVPVQTATPPTPRTQPPRRTFRPRPVRPPFPPINQFNSRLTTSRPTNFRPSRNRVAGETSGQPMSISIYKEWESLLFEIIFISGSFSLVCILSEYM